MSRVFAITPQLINMLMEELSKSNNISTTRTYIQAGLGGWGPYVARRDTGRDWLIEKICILCENIEFKMSILKRKVP